MNFRGVGQGRAGLLWNRFHQVLSRPVDAASLAVFRICFGLIICLSAVRYLWPVGGTSRLELKFSSQEWHFGYPLFEWVQPWPEPWLHVHFVVLGLLGLVFLRGLARF